MMTDKPIPDVIRHLDFEAGPTLCECPGCTVHTGRCFKPAPYFTDMHLIHRCKMLGLSPLGGITRLLCQPCLVNTTRAADAYAFRAHQLAKMHHTEAICKSCGMNVEHPGNFLKIGRLNEWR